MVRQAGFEVLSYICVMELQSGYYYWDISDVIFDFTVTAQSCQMTKLEQMDSFKCQYWVISNQETGVENFIFCGCAWVVSCELSICFAWRWTHPVRKTALITHNPMKWLMCNVILPNSAFLPRSVGDFLASFSTFVLVLQSKTWLFWLTLTARCVVFGNTGHLLFMKHQAKATLQH